MRTALDKMDHHQPATPICTNNTTADDLVNDRIKQKRSRAFDMRFYWIKDRVKQGQFHLYWQPGKTNLAEYFTKHHPTSHHRKMRYIYLTPPKTKTSGEAFYCTGADLAQGCVEPRRDWYTWHET